LGSHIEENTLKEPIEVRFRVRFII